MAARYQRQQYLIGPSLFPTYSYVLKLVLTWATAIYAIANAVNIAVSNQGGEAVLRAALRLPWIWLINAAIVTLIFVVIELSSARFPEKFRALWPHPIQWPTSATAQWSPLDLPPVGAGDERLGQAAELHAGVVGRAFRLLFSGLRLARSPLSVSALWSRRVVSPLPAVSARSHVVDVLLVAGRDERIRAGVEDRGTCARRMAKAEESRRHLAMNALSLIPLCVLLMAPNHVLFLLKNPGGCGQAWHNIGGNEQGSLSRHS